MDERSTIHVGKYTSPMDPVGISSPKFTDGNCFGPNGTFMLLHQSQTTHEISIFPSGHEIIFVVKLMDVWKTTLTQYQLHNDISRESKGTVPPPGLTKVYEPPWSLKSLNRVLFPLRGGIRGVPLNFPDDIGFPVGRWPFAGHLVWKIAISCSLAVSNHHPAYTQLFVLLATSMDVSWFFCFWS